MGAFCRTKRLSPVPHVVERTVVQRHRLSNSKHYRPRNVPHMLLVRSTANTLTQAVEVYTVFDRTVWIVVVGD
jgi:hypothetical protein